MPFQLPSQPKSLRSAEVRKQRAALLREPHIAPLTDLVERIRRETRLNKEVPYFDPLDAGTEAECIFIGQAPGPGAVESGFVSRDNADESARHFFELTREAGLDRWRSVTWNAIPWHMEGNTISAVDLEDGLAYLKDTLTLLPHLRAMVFLGEKAQKLVPRLARLYPRLKRFTGPLPSPLFVNRSPGNRDKIAAVFREIAAYLGPSSPT